MLSSKLFPPSAVEGLSTNRSLFPVLLQQMTRRLPPTPVIRFPPLPVIRAAVSRGCQHMIARMFVWSLREYIGSLYITV